jgi:hypothetical protein
VLQGISREGCAEAMLEAAAESSGQAGQPSEDVGWGRNFRAMHSPSMLFDAAVDTKPSPLATSQQRQVRTCMQRMHTRAVSHALEDAVCTMRPCLLWTASLGSSLRGMPLSCAMHATFTGGQRRGHTGDAHPAAALHPGSSAILFSNVHPLRLCCGCRKGGGTAGVCLIKGACVHAATAAVHLT